MNSLDLPPRRRMPPDVRDRLRARLVEPPGRAHRLRAPLAVAAGVAVLAAGAVFVSQLASGPAGPADPPTSTTSRSWADKQLDRCWAALKSDGMTGGYPDRATWRPVIDQRAPWVSVTGAVAGDRVLFCQTTTNTATITYPHGVPAAVPGSGTGVMLRTREGVLAGVADPSWEGVGVIIGEGDGTYSTIPAIQEGGMFTYAGNVDLTDPNVTVEVYNLRGDNSDPPQQGEGLPVGSAPPEVTFMDRPNASSPEAEQDLRLCLEDNSISPAGWASGAGANEGDQWLVLARNGNRVVSCDYSMKSTEGYRIAELGNEPVPGPTQAPRRLLGVPWDGAQKPVAGVVSAEAAYVRVEVGGRLLWTPVVNSTFVTLPGVGAVTKVFVYDENDKLLYQGPFA